MKNNQVKITFQDNEQTAVVQITQMGMKSPSPPNSRRNSIWMTRTIPLH